MHDRTHGSFDGPRRALGDVWTDLRFGLRCLLRRPGFSAVAVLSLALGIGVNTLIFSLVWGVFFQPLPVPQLDRVVELYRTFAADEVGAEPQLMASSFLNYQDIRDRTRAFDHLSASCAAGLSMTASAEPEQVVGSFVTANYFDVLGQRPARGRFFTPDDDVPGGREPTVVLSHRLWTQRFAADPAVVGSTLRLNGLDHEVIGIAAEPFRGTRVTFAPDLWVPAQMWPRLVQGTFGIALDHRGYRLWDVHGRLADGVSIERARADVAAQAVRLAEEHPEWNRNRSAVLRPLAESTLFPNQEDTYTHAAALLMSCVGLVLLIACANVASLMLAQAAGRRRELAVRLSLGAGRPRLVRQLLTESLLLAVAGGGGGWLLAHWGRDLLWRLRPETLSNAGFELRVDGGVLAYTTALSIATGLVFGMLPALRASRTHLVEGLKVVTTPADGASSLLGRRAMVAAQVALSVVTLALATLFLQSLGNAAATDVGYDTSRLLLVRYDLAGQGLDEDGVRGFNDRVLARAAALPGVQSAALSSDTPLAFTGMSRIFPDDVLDDPQLHETLRDGIYVSFSSVTDGYFDTLGIDLLAGRTFDGSERAGDARNIVVNRTLAERFWGTVDRAPGRTIRHDGETYRVVGVVADIQYIQVGETPRPYLYYPSGLRPLAAATLHLRTRSAPGALGPEAEGMLRDLEPDLAITETRTMEDQLHRALYGPRTAVVLLGTFAVLALLLAAVGIYGVVAQSVLDRRREVGIRMALGASRRDLLGLVLGHALAPVFVGILGGALVAAVASRSFAGLLYELSGVGPTALAVAAALMLGVAVFAALVPARRATRVDPLITLRAE